MITTHEPRVGDWIQTYTGRCFWPLDPRASEVRIEDIAHSLAMRCRYAGHCTKFYSVAEHSVLVSQNVAPEHALWGLLHDAAEAYSADVPRPLKRFLTMWPLLEARIMAAVCERFGLPPGEPTEVKDVDFAMLATEQAAVMVPCEREWAALPAPVKCDIRALSPPEAEALYLSRFEELISAVR